MPCGSMDTLKAAVEAGTRSGSGLEMGHGMWHGMWLELECTLGLGCVSLFGSGETSKAS